MRRTLCADPAGVLGHVAEGGRFDVCLLRALRRLALDAPLLDEAVGLDGRGRSSDCEEEGGKELGGAEHDD